MTSKTIIVLSMITSRFFLICFLIVEYKCIWIYEINLWNFIKRKNKNHVYIVNTLWTLLLRLRDEHVWNTQLPLSVLYFPLCKQRFSAHSWREEPWGGRLVSKNSFRILGFAFQTALRKNGLGSTIAPASVLQKEHSLWTSTTSLPPQVTNRTCPISMA